MKNWIFQKSGFQLWLNNSIRAKKYIKYSLRFIVYTPIIILFVYFYQTQPTVEGKNWIKNKWSFLEKGECEKVFPYLGDSEIRDLETIKNIALGNNHKKLRASDCHLKIISNDLKINMTREQIDKLKPIDIFCWCNKHYEKFFQDNYNISFSSQTKAFYTYEIKKKNETIGEITIAHFSFSDGPWMVGWVSSECSESN